MSRQSIKWWEDKEFVKELNCRYKALESGKDKGITIEQLKASIVKLKQKRYGSSRASTT